MKKEMLLIRNRLLVAFIAFVVTFSSTSISVYAASGDTIVYVTKTGNCYHTSNCSSLKKSKIEKTLEEASKKYSPCKNCKPPVLDSSSSKNSSNKAGASSNIQKSSAESVTRSDNVSNQVWISGKGKKYHCSSSCSNMSNPKQISLDDAISKGYSACKKCYK